VVVTRGAQKTRLNAALALTVALAVACLGVVMFTAHTPQATAATAHDGTNCAPETTSCVQVAFPCPNCSVTAGPVTNVGLNQAVYVEISGFPIGDDVGLAMCSLAGGDQIVPEPQCASSIPPAPDCVENNSCTVTESPLEYQYGTVTSSETVLSIGTEYDPDISGAQPIVSQTADQAFGGNQAFGSFFCDNGPANPCGIEVMDIPQSARSCAIGDGFPVRLHAISGGGICFEPTASNTVIIPVTFAQSGSGCGSAPAMQVDATYSVAQFLPAAGEATCTESDGVAPVATDLPSVDDPGCATGAGTHCPVTDVIDGTVPVTFTDDPEDPTTLAEEKSAGGKFAYIPIAVSATEIAFDGLAALSIQGNVQAFPLSTYELTPAQTAGIMTQYWTSEEGASGNPNDDLCGQLSGKARCLESQQTVPEKLLVDTSNGKSDNIDVSEGTSLKPETLNVDTFNYDAPTNNYFRGNSDILGSQKAYAGDTGYALLNPWPFSEGQTAINELNLAAMFSSTGSGATFESTAWMCAAPNLSYSVTLPWGGQASVQDILSGQQILADAEQGPVPATDNTVGLTPPGIVVQNVLAPAHKCAALSSLPIDFAKNTSNVFDYQPSSQPITAAHAMQSAVNRFSGNGGFAFTAMDSSEADFFGLLPAALQNAAGHFVAPTPASITAALNDATANADGTVTPNYDDTSDPAAYPLPMVTYALVSTSPQPTAQQATQLKDLLTNLVTYSHTGGANTAEPLPAGYVSLPDNLYNQALSDISTDILPPGASSTSNGGSGGTSGTSGTAKGAPAGGTGTPGTSGGRGGTGPGGREGRPGRSSSTSSSGPKSTGSSSSPANFVGRLITVTVGNSRFFVPALLVLALLCLLAGPLLYAWPNLRKARAGGTGAGDTGEDGAEVDGGSVPPDSS
jgi:hypothetical protein